MPQKKDKNKTFSSEEDDVLDTNNQASAPGTASLVFQEEEDSSTARSMDLNQVHGIIRNDFSSKISEVLEAIQDVKKDVHDFSSGLDEAEGRISNVEDVVNTEKVKSDTLFKQVTFLTKKLDELGNRSRRSNLRIVNMPEKTEGNDAVAFLEKWLPEVLGPVTCLSTPLIEKAHRLPSRMQPNRSTASPHCEVFKPG